MTDVDEHLLTAAKLSEVVAGELDGPAIYDHAAIVDDRADRAALSFSQSAVAGFSSTQLYQDMIDNFRTEAATRSIEEQNSSLASYLVGVTETDLSATHVQFAVDLLSRLEYYGALSTLLFAGRPNSGKTNTAWLIAELCKARWDDLLIISNAKASIVDHRVTSAYDLALTLLELRGTPMFVLIDEGSTHFDARTKSYDVASQWSPLQKRMSKLGVEVAAVIGHTGKDIDPELKRLCNLAVYKDAPKIAGFYERWPADDDRPADQLFGGLIEDVPPTTVDYDPDEPAPWNWNLDGDVFADDLEWDELEDKLRESGPS